MGQLVLPDMSAGQKFNQNNKRERWLNRTVLGIGLASLSLVPSICVHLWLTVS